MNTERKPINFARDFGAGSNNVAGKADTKPKAEFWLNLGYVTNVKDEETGENRFVSLPMGIPLDTQEHLDTSKGKPEFKAFQHARNELCKDLMQSVIDRDLKPGESFVIPLQGDTGLAIQIRRVSEQVPYDETAENPFLVRKAL